MAARKRRRPPGPRVTYIIREGVDGCFKIGSTTGDPMARLRALQIGNPRTLELAWVFGEDIERDLHDAYAAWRLNGEWFQPESSVLGSLERDFGVEW